MPLHRPDDQEMSKNFCADIYLATSLRSEKIFYRGWTSMGADQNARVPDDPSESVFVRVHPWLNDFGSHHFHRRLIERLRCLAR